MLKGLESFGLDTIEDIYTLMNNDTPQKKRQFQ